MRTLKLETYRDDASGCVRCSNCKFMEHLYMKSIRFSKQCPINVRYAFNLYSAPGLMHGALAVYEDRLDLTPKLMDSLYQCTSCGACDIRCKRNLDLEILGVIEALKVHAAEGGKCPDKLTALSYAAINSKNIYGLPHEKRQDWMPEEMKPVKKADVAYFVGCRSSYRKQEVAKATVSVLNQAGIPLMALQDEWCCGHTQIASGQWSKAQDLVRHNLEAIEGSRAKTVVTSCAECYKTLKVDYPRILGKSTSDMNYQVVHITELVGPQIGEGKYRFTKEVPMKVTFHDPCNLGRLSDPWLHWEGKHLKFGVLDPPKEFRRGEKGVYEPPRTILNRIPGIKLLEMERIKENTWCCGAGAGVHMAFPDFARWTAEERLEEALSTGAEAIISCCPACEELLGQAVKARKVSVRVYDITEIMLKAMS